MNFSEVFFLGEARGVPPYIRAPAWPMLDWIASNFDFLPKLWIFFSTIIMGDGDFWVSRLFHLFSFSYILIITKLYTTFIAILHLLADDDFKICNIIIKKKFNIWFWNGMDNYKLTKMVSAAKKKPFFLVGTRPYSLRSKQKNKKKVM